MGRRRKRKQEEEGERGRREERGRQVGYLRQSRRRRKRERGGFHGGNPSESPRADRLTRERGLGDGSPRATEGMESTPPSPPSDRQHECICYP